MTLTVADVAELQEAVAGCPPGRQLVPVAGASKPPLSLPLHDGVESVDVSALRGVIEYDPAELTLTARAATPVAEINAVLAENGQYLPFDPPLADAGATVGGVVAAGTSGSNALRHGTVRDFVIGVRMVDGTGTLVGGGGKVVKNAAGFDLPKLMVGALGRLGVMTQLSLKILPRPRATQTIEFAFPTTAESVAAASVCAAGPRELDAVDVLPGGRLLIRLGGEPEALAGRAERLVAAVGAQGRVYDGVGDTALWSEARELRLAAPDATIVRVPVSVRTCVALEHAMREAGAATRISLAGNLAWVAWPAERPRIELERVLRDAALTGVVVCGARGAAVVGAPVRHAFGERIRRALDPHRRFLEV
jgi:glycolate oxidase FAD binding subunit